MNNLITKIPHLQLILRKCYYIFFLLFLLSTTTLRADTIYVNASQTSMLPDGLSWQTAFNDLQEALQVSNYGDEIWVAQGTYLPTTTTIRDFSFNLVNGVQMYGGFSGTETNKEDRDWETYPTFLSGDIGEPANDVDNSYTVVNGNEIDSTTILDGFIIEKGNANGSGGQSTGRSKSGGGLYLYSGSSSVDASPIIKNCIFRNNKSVSYGGAIYLQNTANGGASPLLNYCKLENNESSSGGSIYIKGSSKFNPIKIENCELDSSSANFGGAIHFLSDYGSEDLKINYCNFNANNVIADGAGVNVEGLGGDGDIFITNSNFSYNFGEGEGVVITGINYSSIGSFLIQNCTFYDNYTLSSVSFPIVSFNDIEGLIIDKCVFARSNCFALSNLYSTFTLSNTLFHDLHTFQQPSIGYSYSDTSLDVSNCTFVNNSSSYDGIAAVRTLFPGPFDDEEITFQNCLFWNNDVDYIVGNPSTLSGSISISNSLLDVQNCQSISNSTVNCGAGMLYNIDPMFADTAAGDYRLLPCSPGRNTGDNNALTNAGNEMDLQGNPRISEDIVDMGAYEMLPFELQLAQSNSLQCHNDSSGVIELQIQSGCEPVTLMLGQNILSSDSSTYVLDNLTAGDYTFTVTDAQGRIDTLETFLTQPTELEVTLEGTDIICPEAENGTAAAIVEGGTTPYEFLWDNSNMDSLQTDLGPGDYLLTITDANDCTAAQEYEILESSPITFFTNIISASGPNNADGSVELSQFSGGIAPYHFSWSTGDTTAVIGNLLPGDYNLELTDSLGCTQSITFVVGFDSGLSSLSDGQGIVVFPNPVKPNNSVKIQLLNNSYDFEVIEVRDITGRMIFKSIVEESSKEIRFIAPMERGIYLLTLSNVKGDLHYEKMLVE